MLLVSHDRAFLDNLVTSTLALSSDGQVREYIGGYDDWRQQRQGEAQNGSAQKAAKPAAAMPVEAAPAQRKPSYKEQRALEAQKLELAELPGRIERLEAEQHQLAAAMAEAGFYQQDNALITQAVNRLKELEVELTGAYQRWEELEER